MEPSGHACTGMMRGAGMAKCRERGKTMQAGADLSARLGRMGSLDAFHHPLEALTATHEKE